MPSLRLTAPGHPPTVYNLHKKITSIGSGRDNDVVLPDPLVPDAFAIHFDGQTYTVFAPKKTEFTVNGKKRSKHKLSHDERLVIGSCDLRFVMVDEAPPPEEEAAKTVSDVDAYQKLHEFSERLIHQRDLGELLAPLMDAVIEITNADKGFLMLLEGEQLDVKIARNLNREHIADAVSQLSDSIIAKVVRSRKLVIVSDALRVGGKPGREDDRVRLTVQLTRVSDQTDVWARRWDVGRRQIAAVQADIAREVVARLGAHT